VTALLAAPILLPLFAAAAAVGFGRWQVVQRVISVTTLSVVTVVTAVLVAQVDRDGIVTVQAGRWQAPIGITLVADRTSAIMLVVAMLMLLAVLVFAIGQPGAERNHVGFHPVYLMLTAGVAAAFLTGDLFNLFVAFEIMLMSSYVLLTLGGRSDQVRSGMTYVVISLVASTLFLITLAFVYASTGTVNFADLAGKIAELPSGLRSGLAVLLIAVFGVKSAIFPLFFWLPDSYPTAPTPVTAVFAGLLTKVGVYAMIRSQTLLFPDDTVPTELLLVIAGLTMVVGILGAITQNDIKRILSFHIVSQIGYMVMGLGLYTVAGLAGAVLFTVNQIVVKSSLFLVAGLVELRAGTGALARLSGLARVQPVLAVLFLVPALSLAGLPPFSGFVAKLALVDAGVGSEQWLIVAVSLAVSLLTLFSMTKIWANAFWGRIDIPTDVPLRPVSRAGGRLMIGATAALVGVGLAIAVWAEPLYRYSERAAADLIDPTQYVEAVLRP
jgi:multicomponent Na+:H+ antiporter subunit D